MGNPTPERPKLVRIFEVIGIGSIALAVIVSGIDDWIDTVFYVGEFSLVLLLTQGGYGWARRVLLFFTA